MYSNPDWYNEHSKQFLSDYLNGDSLEERLTCMANASQSLLEAEAERLGKDKGPFAQVSAKVFDYIHRGWIVPATPEWINFGKEKGLPISCYGSNISDSIESLSYAQGEISVMTKNSGGTSCVISMRPKETKFNGGGTANGPLYYLDLIQYNVNRITQGSARRGHCAVWMPVNDPSIYDFLQIRSDGFFIQDLSFGVVIPEGWMESLIEGDAAKRKIWAKILEIRSKTGYPYIMFSDNVRKGAPEVYRDQWSKFPILHSNMCSEIALPNNEEESFVCCLMSMNLAKYDEWKDTDAVEVATFFLDSVISEFIAKASRMRLMDRAVTFATKHRAIGIGQQGWHTYLIDNMIPYESMEAKMLTSKITKQIAEQSRLASEKLAKFLEPCAVCANFGVMRRNTTTTAIAPTKSTSFICGQNSEGTEPWQSNYFVDDKQKIKFTFKNPRLVEVLEGYGKNDANTWKSILMNRGSVQHLDFLSEKEKFVFKTFSEISQKEVIIQASIRQKNIDQSQSLNVLIHPKTPPKDINSFIIEGWRLGIKTFYYHKSMNAAQEFTRSQLEECVSCEG